MHFKNRYRMRKETARFIIQLVEEELGNFENNRGLPINTDIQVLATLRYLAKGAYGTEIADHHGISQPSLSKIAKRVVVAIARHRERFISFPDYDEQQSIKADFYRIAGCPRIVGAIDCTHINIKNPGGDYPVLFINRKGYYSLNVQVVSDSKCRIRDIVERWRGSTHDSRIWKESSLKRRFQAGDTTGILLGDNGYASTRYLLTPVLNPVTNAENRYNRAHCSTRNVVERLFGIWKNKFRCFFNGLNLKLETTKAAIVAAANVHNIIINDKLENERQDLSDDDNDDEHPDAEDFRVEVEDNAQGNIFRRQYIQRYFN
ncbi:putative nuclease HARBI1 [Anoplophora glabripennis]|uniref:putative nuclease HARBI1 n=1 Tax=Anoplophora glabripennis TaxID=217634 RepID=UPI000C769A78|nr:putative nuclease HARBI1 [Anoplophora glabripennis]